MTAREYVVAVAPFEAARSVPILGKRNPARRLHGHSFLAKVRARLDGSCWAQFPGDEPAFLKQRTTQCVAPLNYAHLNDQMGIPTDENIARWIKARIVDVPGIDVIGVQSTCDQGVDLDELNRAHVWRRFRFEAAHQLPNVPEGHQCGRMHGHGFEVILHATEALGDREISVDFDVIAAKWRPLHEKLHLSCLNDIKGLKNPTSEILAKWIWEKLKPKLPQLSWVSVYETVTAGCHYDGEYFRIWKEQRFESAVTLKRAPETDPRSRLHGHSFLTRLHLSAPLDPILGWTVDYGDVKQLFKPVYDSLDHRQLDNLDQLADSDALSIVRWMRERTVTVLPQLDRIDLYETPGCGVFSQWGDNGPALPALQR